jgi:hypothetical protein
MTALAEVFLTFFGLTNGPTTETDTKKGDRYWWIAQSHLAKRFGPHFDGWPLFFYRD